MGNSVRNSALGCVLLLTALAFSAAAEDGPLFAWRATSEAGEVVLFGSVHVGTPDMYPLPPAVEAAFKDAAALAVEADVANQNMAKMMATVQKHGMYAATRPSPKTCRKT